MWCCHVSIAHEETLTSLEGRLRASEKTVEEQRALIKELREKQAEQTAALKELKKEREDRKVSFSASLREPGAPGSTGPDEEEVTLIYQHVITNIGGAYNPDTGGLMEKHHFSKQTGLLQCRKRTVTYCCLQCNIN